MTTENAAAELPRLVTYGDLQELAEQLLQYASEAILLFDTAQAATSLDELLALRERLQNLSQNYANYREINRTALKVVSEIFVDMDCYRDDVVEVDPFFDPFDRRFLSPAEVDPKRLHERVDYTSGLDLTIDWHCEIINVRPWLAFTLFAGCIKCDSMFRQLAGLACPTEPVDFRVVLLPYLRRAFNTREGRDRWITQFREVEKSLCCILTLPSGAVCAEVDDRETTPDADRSNPDAADIASRLPDETLYAMTELKACLQTAKGADAPDVKTLRRYLADANVTPHTTKRPRKYRRCDAEPVMNKNGLYWRNDEGTRTVASGSLRTS